MLTRAQLEALLVGAQADPRSLIEQAFRIQTKAQPGQAPVDYLRLNAPQLKIHQAIQAQRQAGRAPRVIVLKARQPGASTLCCAYAAANLLSRPYAQNMVIAHLDDAAIGLLKKVRFMLDGLPEALRPYIKTDRRGELALRGLVCVDGELQLETACYVGTATGQELWRSKTLQFAHLSEFSAFPRPEETLLGVMQAVPVTPQSLVVIESTARGMGNLFHEEWVRAETGESEFVPVFIGWWELPDAAMAVSRDFQLEPDERELKRAFGLTNEQLQWRRYMIYTSCAGDADRFDQEFPSSPSVAFLVTGRPAFPLDILRELREQAEKVVPLRNRQGTYPATGIIGLDGKFIRMERGPLTVFAPPVPGHEYVIGADVAAGIEGGDYSCAQVFDRQAEEQVAVWHGYINPVQFAHICAGLGQFYQQAILAPEVTGGWGYSVVEELKAVCYSRLYVWSRHDRVRNVISNFFGWETTPRSRPLLINSLAHALLERAVRLRDVGTIDEAMQFQYTDGRRAEGLKHDDRIMAFMIAYRVHLEYPMEATGLPPRIRLPDDGVPVQSGPPLPARSVDREAWQEADEAVRRIEHGSVDMVAEYGIPDPEAGELPPDEAAWMRWGW